MYIMSNYKNKYLKYKNKYLHFKSLHGGFELGIETCPTSKPILDFSKKPLDYLKKYKCGYNNLLSLFKINHEDKYSSKDKIYMSIDKELINNVKNIKELKERNFPLDFFVRKEIDKDKLLNVEYNYTDFKDIDEKLLKKIGFTDDEIKKTKFEYYLQLEQNNKVLEQNNKVLEQNNKVLEQKNKEFLGEIELLNIGDLRIINKQLLQEYEKLINNNKKLVHDNKELVTNNEKIKKESLNFQVFNNLIIQLKTNISNGATNNSEIVNNLKILNNEINLKRWYIPKVPLDIHHDNNYEVITPQNEKECYIKIKSPVEYVKGVCYIESKQVIISEGYYSGQRGDEWVDDKYSAKEIKTFKADNTSINVSDSNRADLNYYKLRDGLQTPIDAMLSKCYTEASAKVKGTSVITLTDHNSEADSNNKLLLQKIQMEMTPFIKIAEENIKLETNKTNEIIENINKMKSILESICWIIPRVPLEAHHPQNYEEIILKSNKMIDFNNTYYIKHDNKFMPGILNKSVKTIYHEGYGYGNEGAYTENVEVFNFIAHDTSNQKYVKSNNQTFYKLKDGFQTQDEFELAQCYKDKIQSRTLHK